MNNLNFNTRHFNCHAGKAGFAALVVAASITVGSSAAYAAVVCGSASLPAAVPANGNGLYINFVTNAIGSASFAAPGYDFNPYGTTNLYFYTDTSTANTFAILGGGTAATSPSVLAPGATIGPAGTYLTAGTGTNPAWQTTVTGMYVGVHFNNEAGTTQHYGWVQINATGAAGVPATVNAYCWENTPNTAIVAGNLPVSLQKFSID